MKKLYLFYCTVALIGITIAFATANLRVKKLAEAEINKVLDKTEEVEYISSTYMEIVDHILLHVGIDGFDPFNIKDIFEFFARNEEIKDVKLYKVSPDLQQRQELSSESIDKALDELGDNKTLLVNFSYNDSLKLLELLNLSCINFKDIILDDQQKFGSLTILLSPIDEVGGKYDSSK